MRRPLRPDTYSHLFFRLNNLKVHDFFGLAILNFVSGFRSRPKKAKEYFFQRFKNIFLKLFFTFFDRFWKTFFLLRNEKWTKQQFNFFFSTSGEKNTKQLKIFVSWLGFRFFPSPEIRFGKVLEYLSELFLKTNTRQQHDSVGRSPKRRRRRRRRRRSTMRRRCFNYSIADVISFLAEQFFRKLRRVRPRQRGQRFCLLLFFLRKIPAKFGPGVDRLVWGQRRRQWQRQRQRWRRRRWRRYVNMMTPSRSRRSAVSHTWGRKKDGAKNIRPGNRTARENAIPIPNNFFV